MTRHVGPLLAALVYITALAVLAICAALAVGYVAGHLHTLTAH